MDGIAAGHVAVGHPVDVATGDYFVVETDHEAGGIVPIVVRRTYSTRLLHASVTTPAHQGGPSATPLGRGWRASWQVELRQTLDGFTYTRHDGLEMHLPSPRDGGFEATGRLLSPAHGLELTRLDERHLLLASFGVDRSPRELVFARAGAGMELALVAIRQTASARLDVLRDDAGRVVGLAQAREGKVLRIAYEGDRVVRTELHAPGEAARVVGLYAYDDRGRLSAFHDARGLESVYRYDAADRMIAQEERRGSHYVMRYDARGRCAYVSGADRYQERTLRWDDRAQSSFVADSHGHVTRYDFNAAGQVVRETRPSGAETTFEFDEAGRPTKSVSPTGGTTETTYDLLGRTIAVTRPDGRARRFEHDDAHRVVAFTDEAGRRTTIERSATGDAVRVTPEGAPTWTFRYDAHGALVRVVNGLGAEKGIGHDAHGNATHETDWQGNVWRARYDGFGRMVEKTDPLGGVTTFAYDDADELQEIRTADGRVSRQSTSPAGTETTFVRPDGRQRSIRYSSCMQPLEVVHEDGAVTRYEWDTEPGRLLAIVSPGGDRYRFDYDPDGNPSRRETFDGRVFHHVWARGLLVENVDPAGRRVAFEHDALGRVVRRRDESGTREYTYDARDQLVLVDADGVVTSFEYGPLGSVVAEAQDGVALQRQHDALGNEVAFSTALGDVTRYAYDRNGDCVSLHGAGTRIAIERDALGRESRRHLPGAGTLEQTYDPLGRLLSQDLRRGDERGEGPASVLHRDYAYGAGGLLARVRDSLTGEALFAHGARDDLLAVVRPDGVSELFDVDASRSRVAGARSERGREILERAGKGEVTSFVRAAEQLGSAVSVSRVGPGGRLARVQGPTRTVDYTYDACGQVIARTVWDARGATTTRFEWNARGQLVAATLPDGATWTYRYDGLGRRLEKRSPEGRVHRFVWDGYRIAHELVDGAVHRSWSHLPGDVVPALAVDARVHYVIADQVEAPGALVSTSGAVESITVKGAWGEQTRGTERPFAGQWLDEETGLHYNVLRHYDPETGRYLSPDPIGILGGHNEYAFVPSPVGWTDPLGLAALCDKDRKRADKVRAKLMADMAGGEKIPRTADAHPENHAFSEPMVRAILAEPDAVFLSTGKERNIIFLKGEDVAVVTGPGSGQGNLITAYGSSGIKGDSGAAALGGSPSDRGAPITDTQITSGTIPVAPGKPPVPPAEKIWP